MEIEKQRMWILIEILFMEEDKGSDGLMSRKHPFIIIIKIGFYRFSVFLLKYD